MAQHQVVSTYTLRFEIVELEDFDAQILRNRADTDFIGCPKCHVVVVARLQVREGYLMVHIKGKREHAPPIE